MCTHRWILLLLLITSPAQAATYHVATTGNDGVSCPNADFSPNNTQAKLTIASGLDCLNSGDTLIIHAGIYNTPRVFITDSGSSDSVRTIIQGEGPGVTIIRGISGNDGVLSFNSGVQYATIKDLTIDGNDATHVASYASEVNFIRYQNVEITGARHSGVQGDGNAHEYLNLHVHHNGTGTNSVCGPGGSDPPGQCHGLYIFGTNHVFDGGDYHHQEASSLHFRNGINSGGPHCTNCTIRNIKLHDDGWHCMQANQYSGAIYNNVVYNCGKVGLLPYAGAVEFYNNTIHGNGEQGIYMRDSAPAVLVNNIVYNNGGTIDTLAGGIKNHNLCNTAGGGCDVLGNPAFVNLNSDDFHLTNTSAAINVGINLAGTPATDADGKPRVGAVDIGAYECQNLSGPNCGGPPPQPDPIGLVAEYLGNGNANDNSGNDFTASLVGGALANAAAIVQGNSFFFDGINDQVTAPADAAFRPAAITMGGWFNLAGFPGPTPGYCHLMAVARIAVVGVNDQHVLFAYVNNATTVEWTTPLVAGQSYLIAMSYDGLLRLWVNNAIVASANVGETLAYVGTEQFTFGGGNGTFCNARADNVRFRDDAINADGMANWWGEQPPVSGTAATHSRFEQAEQAEGTAFPGTGVDAPNILVSRSAKLVQAWVLTRVGSTITKYFPMFCASAGYNGGIATKLTNSCATFPLCITDSARFNMGDSTGQFLPLDGMTNASGRWVVDTINPAMKTTLADGQRTEWRYEYAFNQSIPDDTVIICKPHDDDDQPFAAGNYPGVIPTITIDVPPPGRSLAGGRIEGGTWK